MQVAHVCAGSLGARAGTRARDEQTQAPSTPHVRARALLGMTFGDESSNFEIAER